MRILKKEEPVNKIPKDLLEVFQSERLEDFKRKKFRINSVRITEGFSKAFPKEITALTSKGICKETTGRISKRICEGFFKEIC